ncbi:MAG TPA: hypothetical protein VFX98_03245 [Longimicrobiaceae bacterium]|nr:hypothetical protein [Longimicrobiaceae bacterium]
MYKPRWIYPTLAALALTSCEGGPTESQGACAGITFAVAIDPAGKALLYTPELVHHHPDHAIRPMRRMPLPGTPLSVAVRTDGRFGVVPMGTAGAALVSFETGTVVGELRVAGGSADAAAWNGDEVVFLADRAAGVVTRFRVAPGAAPVQTGQVSVPAQPLQLLVYKEQVLVLSVASRTPGQGGRITSLDPQTLQTRWSTTTYGVDPVGMSVFGLDLSGTGEYKEHLSVLNANNYALQPTGAQAQSRVAIINLATRALLRTFAVGEGATAYYARAEQAFVTTPTRGTTVLSLMQLNDYGPKQFFCARDASGACRDVTSAWGTSWVEVFQTVADRPWIYKFEVDYSRTDASVHVVTDSIALPAGSVGAAALEQPPVALPCNDVIEYVG